MTMAIHKGSSGTVMVGSASIASIRSYAFDEQSETIETTTLGDVNKSYVSSVNSWSGSVDVYFDETDTSQSALTAGAEVTLKFYVEGTASGDKYWTGNAIVTGFSVNASNDSMVESSISVIGNGDLTLSTV